MSAAQENQISEAMIQQRIYRMAFFLLGDYHDACDLSQEVFLELEKGRRKWEQANSKLAWAIGVLHRQLQRFLRHKCAHKAQELVDDVAAVTVSAENDLVAKEKLRQTLIALKNMNKDLAEALWLFSHENLSIKAIAALQQCSEGTVKWRIFEARRHLASQVKDS